MLIDKTNKNYFLLAVFMLMILSCAVDSRRKQLGIDQMPRDIYECFSSRCDRLAMDKFFLEDINKKECVFRSVGQKNYLHSSAVRNLKSGSPATSYMFKVENGCPDIFIAVLIDNEDGGIIYVNPVIF